VETYYFRRYRRKVPGHNTGTVMDELSFKAGSAAEAEESVRGRFGSGIAVMDWQRDFARLEDDEGHILRQWLSGFSDS
jgi:hypothetical protein